MKKLIKSLSSWVMVLTLAIGLCACESEKKLIIIEDDLPLISETLYMLGNAAPCGWTITDPTPFTPTEEDPLVFTWQGTLGMGELKLLLTPSQDWNIPFIRPLEAGQTIGKTNYTDEPFTMHTDPDDKWNVIEAGEYKLTFDLRHWTFNTEYLKGPERPAVVPVKADAVYVIGMATSAMWNIGEAIETKKLSDYIFEYEGYLSEGEFRACTERAWGTHIRPVENQTEINEDGVADEDFIYVATPDINWLVTKAAKYRVTFDLEHWKINVKCLKDEGEENEPIETSTLFMMGTSTKGGWDGEAMTPFQQDPSDPYVFTYEGTLSEGELKLYTEAGSDYEGKPAIRPAFSNTEIGESEIIDAPFVYQVEPDNKWNVKAGKYRLSFNLRTWKMSSTYLGEPEYEWPAVAPIQTETLYLLGDAAPGLWNITTACTKKSEYIFEYEGQLNAGRLRASTVQDWGVHIRPKTDNLAIGKDGCASEEFVYVTTPDFNWNVVDAGKYRLTFDLENWKITVKYLDGEGGDEPDPDTPIKTSTLFMLGSCTKGGWDGNAMTPMQQDSSDPNVFTYEGSLAEGELKIYTELGDDYGAKPAIRPETPDVEIGENDIVDAAFVYVAAPDNKWNVKAGKYHLTFNLRTYKMSSKYLGGYEYDWPEVTPIVTEHMYLIGWATSIGWTIEQAIELTGQSDYIFVYEGYLSQGSFRACTERSYDIAHIRPKVDNMEVGKAGCSSNEFVLVTSPDFNWNVADAGNYRITFDLEHWTVNFEYLN
ncbi:MAG: SusF/SusE family outer membrane protein [Candidatus Cryptobacteroides sp.]